MFLNMDHQECENKRKPQGGKYLRYTYSTGTLSQRIENTLQISEKNQPDDPIGNQH